MNSKRAFKFMVILTLVVLVVVPLATVAAASSAHAQSDLDFFSLLLEKVLVAVLPILATALTAWVIQQIRSIGKKLSAEQMAYIKLACEIAVNAAEQSGAAGYITDKKEYAIDMAQRWLEKQNIKVDLGLIADAIEAAVMTEINRDKILLSE